MSTLPWRPMKAAERGQCPESASKSKKSDILEIWFHISRHTFFAISSMLIPPIIQASYRSLILQYIGSSSTPVSHVFIQAFPHMYSWSIEAIFALIALLVTCVPLVVYLWRRVQRRRSLIRISPGLFTTVHCDRYFALLTNLKISKTIAPPIHLRPFLLESTR